MKTVNEEYLAKVKLLDKAEKERLLSRMVGKLPRRLQKEKIDEDEAIAMQLELEDQQLEEWRERMRALKAADESKESKKTK